MYHVYTIDREKPDFSKTAMGDFRDFDAALEKAEKCIENKPELRYVIEETDGDVNSYGDLIANVVVESE